MGDHIRITNKKNGRYYGDNDVINHYGGLMGATGIAVYTILCKYANGETQQCWPSIETICLETGMHRETVIRVTNALAQLKIIKKKAKVGRSTIYTMLEPVVDEKEKEKIIESYLKWSENRTGTDRKTKAYHKQSDIRTSRKLELGGVGNWYSNKLNNKLSIYMQALIKPFVEQDLSFLLKDKDFEHKDIPRHKKNYISLVLAQGIKNRDYVEGFKIYLRKQKDEKQYQIKPKRVGQNG